MANSRFTFHPFFSKVLEWVAAKFLHVSWAKRMEADLVANIRRESS